MPNVNFNTDMNAISESENETSPGVSPGLSHHLRCASNPESPVNQDSEDSILEMNKSDGETLGRRATRKFSRKPSIFHSDH
jgi:hypothetical protein